MASNKRAAREASRRMAARIQRRPAERRIAEDRFMAFHAARRLAEVVSEERAQQA